MTLRSRSAFFTRRTKRTTFSIGGEADAVAHGVEIDVDDLGDVPSAAML
jgi:hypothetical protein